MLKDILFEDKDIIVVKKPFGVPSQEDKSGDESLYRAVMDYLCQKGEKGCETGLIHRLDRPVSGIMVFGKNKKASAELSAQLAQGGFSKEYTAVVCGNMEGSGRLTDWILKNQRLNISKAVNKNSPSAKKAVLEYQAVCKGSLNGEELTLVKIKLFTGRHHQIRVQLANAGFPVWGDTKYNPAVMRKRGFKNIGLSACSLEFNHPATGERLAFKIKETAEPFSVFDYAL